MGYYFGFLIFAYALQGFLALGNDIGVGSIGTPKYFNVLDYGAVGDGKKDDSQAFLKAWSDLCKNVGGSPTLVIPAPKIFLVTPFSFHGPCKSRHVRVKIQGAVVAPNNRGAWRNCENNAWISFSNIDNLIVEGLGVINGQGSIWWHKQFPINQIQHDQMCNRPKALCFTNCNGLRLSGLRVVDSPAAHIVVTSCNYAIISNIRISSPEHSPNTDGIDLSMSTNVQIRDSFIGSGDDCIAIGSKTSFVNISGISCGPGHGISIGSLGRNGGYAQVEEIHVRHCTFNRTLCGARIKTWEGGSGYARHINYDDITLIQVHNPISIDQHYWSHGIRKPTTSAVKISDVRYSGFMGTSATLAAISLNCSEAVACTNIVMDSIKITSLKPTDKTFAICENARGTTHLVVPPVSCLKQLTSLPQQLEKNEEMT